jgi:hypothetical protein
MRKLRVVIFSLLLLLPGAWAFARGGNPYERINDPAQAKEIFQDIREDLKTMFGMTVSGPVELNLVEPKVMDDLFKSSPYHGAEIGLYRHHNGRHEIYVMKDWSRDLCSGVTAHEYTHAWQTEHCPPGQEQVIREGFARWVEAKYYDKIGAYQMVENLRAVGDPVYGVGYKTMLAWEDKYGAPGLVKLVQKVNTVADVK